MRHFLLPFDFEKSQILSILLAELWVLHWPLGSLLIWVTWCDLRCCAVTREARIAFCLMRLAFRSVSTPEVPRGGGCLFAFNLIFMTWYTHTNLWPTHFWITLSFERIQAWSELLWGRMPTNSETTSSNQGQIIILFLVEFTVCLTWWVTLADVGSFGCRLPLA